MKKAVFLIGALAMICGCGHLESHVALFREPSPPTNHADVYLANEVVPRPYSEMALVQAIGYGNDMDVAHVVTALRSRAESLGCDGVVHVQIDVGYMRAHAAGVCVQFVGPVLPVVPPAEPHGIPVDAHAPLPLPAAPPISPSPNPPGSPASRAVDNPGTPF